MSQNGGTVLGLNQPLAAMLSDRTALKGKPLAHGDKHNVLYVFV